jgi:DNA invertase Pin-like site-specific DNA recombinase
VVTRLDRVGRSVGDLVSVAGELLQRGLDLMVLEEAIDTSTPAWADAVPRAGGDRRA